MAITHIRTDGGTDGLIKIVFEDSPDTYLTINYKSTSPKSVSFLIQGKARKKEGNLGPGDIGRFLVAVGSDLVREEENERLHD